MAKDVEVKFTVTGIDGSIKDLKDLVGAINNAEEAAKDATDATKKQADEQSGLEKRISGIKDTYKGMVSSLKFATKGIKTFFTAGSTGAKILKVSLAALGIPLLIAAVVALVNYFKNFEVVTRTLSKIMNGLGAVVANVGKAFSLIARGKFGEAFQTIKDGVIEAVEATDKLYDSQKRLADIQKENLIENAKLRQETEFYKKTLEDTTQSTEKRLAALDQVTKRTKQLAQNQLEENQALIDGLQAQIAIENNEVARRDLEVELAELRADRINQQTELNNIEFDAAKVGREIVQTEKDKKAAIQERIDAEAAKEAEASEAKKQKMLEDAAFVQEQLQSFNTQMIADTFERAQEEIRIEKEKQLALLASKGASEEQLAQVEAFYADKSKKLTDEKAKYEEDVTKATEDAKLAVAASAFDAIASLAGESSAVGKAAAIASTVIATYQGAQSAFAQTPGGIVLKSIAAGTAIATGLANVRKIVQTKTPGGKSAGAAPSIQRPQVPSTNGTRGINNVLGGFEANNTVTSESVQKTYVVAEDVTSAQEASKKVKDLARL